MTVTDRPQVTVFLATQDSDVSNLCPITSNSNLQPLATSSVTSNSNLDPRESSQFDRQTTVWKPRKAAGLELSGAEFPGKLSTYHGTRSGAKTVVWRVIGLMSAITIAPSVEVDVVR